MNGPKNTARLVFLPSAWRHALILARQSGLGSMKQEPGVGESAAELVLLLVVLLALIAGMSMLCSSAPLAWGERRPERFLPPFTGELVIAGRPHPYMTSLSSGP